MQKFTSHPFFKKLLSLDFPRDDFTIAGSGPLFARGLIAELNDLDVVARGDAWGIAVQHGRLERAPYSTVRVVKLFDDQIEVLNGWFPEVWRTDDLINGSDVIDGYRFVSLDVVRQAKEIMHRPKDILHLEIIEKYLAGARNDPSSLA